MAEIQYPYDSKTSETIWQRLLRGGPLEHLPRKETDLMLLLAHAASQFDEGVTYSESDVRERLKMWLATFASPHGVDHVTVRRYLTDLGFLGRDPAGVSYILDATKLDSMIEVSTRALKPGLILKQIEFEREQRRIQFSK